CDLDICASQLWLLTLLHYTRRFRSGSYGTGVGLVAPLRQCIESGLAFRLTLGTQMSRFRGHRFTIPVELNADLIFRRGEEAATEARLALVTGIDLLQRGGGVRGASPSNRPRVDRPHQGGGAPGRGPLLRPRGGGPADGTGQRSSQPPPERGGNGDRGPGSGPPGAGGDGRRQR